MRNQNKKIRESITYREGINTPTTPVLRGNFNQMTKMSIVYLNIYFFKRKIGKIDTKMQVRTNKKYIYIFFIFVPDND